MQTMRTHFYGNVISIYDHDGEIWIGGQSGLDLFEQGHFRRFQLAGSEPLRGVSGIVLAKNGDLWLNQASGVVHIAADEVAHAREDPQYQVRYELLNYLDGLTSSPEQLRPVPHRCRIFRWAHLFRNTRQRGLG